MESLTSLYASPLIHSLGWALLHSLWQGTLIALLIALLLRAFPGKPGSVSQLRYLLACAGLLALAAVTTLTCVYYLRTYEGLPIHSTSILIPEAQTSTPLLPDAVAPPLLNPVESVASTAAPGLMATVDPYLPWIVLAWWVGLLCVSCRLFAGWMTARRLRHRLVTPAPSAVLESVSTLCQTMRISRAVRVLESGLAVTPMIVGWLRPVLLLPTSSLTGLTPQQLQSILAHELAHVMRHDYLANLLQCLIETLLFYHPAVWWLGSVIRQERERCCDDLAVRVTGDRVEYARALLHIAESAPAGPGRMALASQGGDLSSRIRRLLGYEPQRSNSRGSVGIWAVLSSLCLIVVLGVSAQAQNETAKTPEESPSVSASQPPDTEARAKDQQRIIDIPYRKLIEGDPAYNIVIRPNDVIKVSEPASKQFIYIQGLINRPGAYSSPGPNTLTLKQLVISAGGVPEGPPVFIKLVRRVKPDREETTYFSWDDLMEGWTQDAFLAPNDLISLSHDPGPEDQAAKERRELRALREVLRTRLNSLNEQTKTTLKEYGENHRIHRAVALQIKASQDELERIAKLLTIDPDQGDTTILPAPDTPPAVIGEPPRPDDLVPGLLPNTAQPGDRVKLFASNADRQKYQTSFVRAINDRGELSLPGIVAVPFMGRPINDIEADVLRKMQAQPDYQQTEIVTINLPDRWVFTATGPTIQWPGLHTLPHEGFRLIEALGRLGEIPEDTQRVLIIRQPPNIPPPAISN